jgi:hypothetical protein
MEAQNFFVKGRDRSMLPCRQIDVSDSPVAATRYAAWAGHAHGAQGLLNKQMPSGVPLHCRRR